MLAIVLRCLFFYLARVAHAYSCINFATPITVTPPSYKPTFPEFANHSDAVQLLVDISSRTADAALFSGSESVEVNFAIDASYCTEATTAIANQDVQVLTHGLGTDKSYWDFGGPDSRYNYIRAATKAGYATLHWSRPGTGLSSSGDPYSILQTDVQAAVLVEITRLLRSGELCPELPRPRGRVVHIGYSFGSVLTNVLIAKYPGLSDGVVLTGLSHDFSFSSRYGIATNFHLAKENRPGLWGNYSSGFLTWADELALQYNTLKHPYFDLEVLARAEKEKVPFAVGELLTLGVPSLVAPDFKGPVLVSLSHFCFVPKQWCSSRSDNHILTDTCPQLTTGDCDTTMCGGNCTSILDPAAVDFPSSSKFATYLQPNSGHALNMHLNASAYFEVILEFLKEEEHVSEGFLVQQ